MSYTASCVPIIMYGQGLFVVVYLLIKISDPNINMCSLVSLWISTFLQNFITLFCLVFELRDLEKKKEEEEKMNKILYHSPLHL